MPRSIEQSHDSNLALGPKNQRLLGVDVSAINMNQALGWIERMVSAGDHCYVCVAAAHSLMDCRRDRELRSIFNRASLVTPDGMPLVWYLRLKGHSNVRRVYGPDLMLALCEHGQKRGLRHFFYGGTPERLEMLTSNLRQQFPDLEIAGTFAPPFRPLKSEEQRELADEIAAAQPDVLWVGIGSPKQERWMARNVGKLEVPVMIGVGAAFDIHADIKPQASLWMQHSGLEWLFRLITEPRRAWRRYRRYPLFSSCLNYSVCGAGPSLGDDGQDSRRP